MAFIGVAAAVVLAMSYVSSASALQEDLQGTGPVSSPSMHRRGTSSPCQITPLPRPLATTWQATIDTFSFGHSLAFDNAMSKDLTSHLIRLPISRFPRRVWVVTGGNGAGIEHFEGTLAYDGYALSKENQFPGVSLYGSARRATVVVIFPTDGGVVSHDTVLDALGGDSTKVKRVVFQATGSSLHNAIIGTATPNLYGWVTIWDPTKGSQRRLPHPKPSW